VPRSPRNLRANLLLLGVIVTAVAIERLAGGPLLLALWLAASCVTLALVRHESGGAVTNTASVLAGRPIALTARGRVRMRVDHVPPEARRLLRQMALLLVVVLVAAAL
jgi:hypothetical protein